MTNLKIIQGASETAVRYDAPNTQVMQDFTFTTGASSVNLVGLGYANFTTMTFSSGAGDYYARFHWRSNP